MSSIGFTVTAVCAGIAGGVALGLMKRSGQGSTVTGVCALLAFVGAWASAQITLVPKVESLYAGYRIDSAAAVNPALGALKQYEPAIYSSVRETLKEKVARGESMDVIRGAVSNVIRELIPSRVAVTSNVAAVNYMRANIDEINHLYRQEGDNCYRALMPKQFPTFNLASHIPKEQMNADLAALAAVVKEAKSSPTVRPTQAQFELAAVPALKKVDQSILRESADIEKPKQSLTERRRACEIVIKMYEEIFKLPTDEAGIAVRYMLSVS